MSIFEICGELEFGLLIIPSQNWLFHDAGGFCQRVLDSSHALPILTWTRAPDAGSSFIALLPPFKDSLIANDLSDFTAKTKSSFKVNSKRG